jgi:glycosyltransferase involved in cell wall biosynthesis
LLNNFENSDEAICRSFLLPRQKSKALSLGLHYLFSLLMSATPLVSVIALCYNHAPFLEEALDSLAFQSYKHFELIIVDDGSRDGSPALLQAWYESYQNKHRLYPTQFPDIPISLHLHQENKGICKRFNEGLALAQGRYVVDFALDDVLLPERLALQVAAFEQLPAHYGVLFGNARYLSAEGRLLHEHYPINAQGKAKKSVPSGDVYRHILERYFICTPTMMMRREVLEALGGYDETLSYEDFDFWLRSSRSYHYHYQDEVHTLRRLVPHSLSTQFYKSGRNRLLRDTLTICRKALLLNRSEAEHAALFGNAYYHLRQAYYMEDFELVAAFDAFLQEAPLQGYRQGARWLQWLLWLSGKKIRVNFLYRSYLYLRARISALWL